MSNKTRWTVYVALFGALASCAKHKEPIVVEPSKGGTGGGARSLTDMRWSAFGPYTPLPQWSGWCGNDKNPQCAAPLAQAVDQPSATSRLIARRHGFHLWAAISAPLPGQGKRNDVRAQRNDLYGTQGCWSTFQDGQPACSGAYPLWLTWPNTGKPYARKEYTVSPEEVSGGEAAASPEATAATASPGVGTLRARRRKQLGPVPVSGAPNPQEVSTVDTLPASSVPSYQLPPLVLERRCKIPVALATEWLDAGRTLDIIRACEKAGAPGVYCASGPGICDGTAFVNQGDVMIATESVSVEGYADIQRNRLYSDAVLQNRYQTAGKSVGSDIGSRYVSTKHMYWPVKACKPGAKLGSPDCRIRYGALPPWQPARYRSTDYTTNADYLGYERWGSVVAIDTCMGGTETLACPTATSAKLALAHVQGAQPIETVHPDVYPASAFQHIQVSREALEARFTPTDRALLDQAMIWAYGDEAVGFEPGDFLVTVAMHVNTKEIPSWGLQSIWWSPMKDRLEDCPLGEYGHCFGQSGAYGATGPEGVAPNHYSGLSKQDIDALDAQVGSAWREHYLLVDSYGVGYQLDGTPVTVGSYFPGKTPPPWYEPGPPPKAPALLPVAANVYIEPVIHPLGTNCQNCHRRAGFPGTSCQTTDYAHGCGRANYQTAQCANLLGDYGPPGKDPCMTNPWAWHGSSGDACQAQGGTVCNGTQAFPVLDTDWIWILADGHVQPHPYFP